MAEPDNNSPTPSRPAWSVDVNADPVAPPPDAEPRPSRAALPADEVPDWVAQPDEPPNGTTPEFHSMLMPPGNPLPPVGAPPSVAPPAARQAAGGDDWTTRPAASGWQQPAGGGGWQQLAPEQQPQPATDWQQPARVRPAYLPDQPIPRPAGSVAAPEAPAESAPETADTADTADVAGAVGTEDIAGKSDVSDGGATVSGLTEVKPAEAETAETAETERVVTDSVDAEPDGAGSVDAEPDGAGPADSASADSPSPETASVETKAAGATSVETKASDVASDDSAAASSQTVNSPMISGPFAGRSLADRPGAADVDADTAPAADAEAGSDGTEPAVLPAAEAGEDPDPAEPAEAGVVSDTAAADALVADVIVGDDPASDGSAAAAPRTDAPNTDTFAPGSLAEDETPEPAARPSDRASTAVFPTTPARPEPPTADPLAETRSVQPSVQPFEVHQPFDADPPYPATRADQPFQTPQPFEVQATQADRQFQTGQPFPGPQAAQPFQPEQPFQPAQSGQGVPPAPAVLPPGAPAYPHPPTAPTDPNRPPGSAADLTSSALLRQRNDVPSHGWRRLIHRLTGGALNPGVSKRDQVLSSLLNRIRTPVRGCHRIAVVSLKGGIGKTTTTACLGLTLAQFRGDRVVAMDANPDAGTLAERLTGDVEISVRDLLDHIRDISTFTEVSAYTTLADRLQVLASDQEPETSLEFDEARYREVCGLLARFYNVVLTDSGTGLLHSAMAGTLAMADSLVVVSAPSVDGASRAAKTLDWLVAHGYHDLVARCVAVIQSVRPTGGEVDMTVLRNHFAARCRAVVEIPYDPHLVTGGLIQIGSLKPTTRHAYLELSAAVGDGFALR